jgi:broad specificity phosphatase PhoE
MPPTIHIVRHAHAAHQVEVDNSLLDPHDPELTHTGIRECEDLAVDMAKLGEIDLILCSPMKRTIQTALAAFPSYTKSKKIVLLPDLQESGIGNTNTGSSLEELVSRFGSTVLDYYYVAPDWTNKEPGTRYDIRATEVRARATRLFIRAIAQYYRDTNAHIVVLTHSFFISHLVRVSSGMLKNVEWASFQFGSIVGGDRQAQLHEVPCGITRRLQYSISKPPGDFKNAFNLSVPVPLAAKADVKDSLEKDEQKRPIGC